MTIKLPILHTSTTGKGPHIVLLHGWGTHSGVWRQMADLLSHFRVTTLDLPGYAGNSKACNEYSGSDNFENMVEQLAESITSPAIWVGWSMGGLLAMGVALKVPQRVKQLVLVASTPRFTSDTDWQAMEPDTFIDFAEQLKQDYDKTLKRFMSLQTMNSENRGALLKLLRQQWHDLEAPSSVVLESGLKILQNTDLREKMSELRCPLSFIYGQLDTMARPGLLNSMKKYHSSFSSVVIEKAAHAPFLSHPLVFKQELLKQIDLHGGLK